jgi:hypothetical protein
VILSKGPILIEYSRHSPATPVRRAHFSERTRFSTSGVLDTSAGLDAHAACAAPRRPTAIPALLPYVQSRSRQTRDCPAQESPGDRMRPGAFPTQSRVIERVQPARFQRPATPSSASTRFASVKYVGRPRLTGGERPTPWRAGWSIRYSARRCRDMI